MNNLIISHMTLRKAIGILGMGLAFIVMIGGLLANKVVEPSISAYYYTNMRDIFVGVLMVTGAFLLSYKGYDKVDNITTTIAGIAAVAIATFPMHASADITTGIFMLSSSVSHIFHMISATSFFVIIGYISFFQFTKSSGIITKQKEKRNLIYRISGLTIAGMILLLLFANIFSIGGYIVLIAEAIMLIAFGTSWLVKGEAILKDIE